MKTVNTKKYLKFSKYVIKIEKTLGTYSQNHYERFIILEKYTKLNTMLLYSTEYGYITEYNINDAYKIGVLNFDYTESNLDIIDKI